MSEYPRITDAELNRRENLLGEVPSGKALTYDLHLDLRDARAMIALIAKREAEIAEMRAVIAAVRELKDEWSEFEDEDSNYTVEDLTKALGKYADEMPVSRDDREMTFNATRMPQEQIYRKPKDYFDLGKYADEVAE